jgi:methionyl-tRNA synthetase
MDEATTPTDPTDDAPSGPPPLDLRVARVRQAREHPNADRLLVLDIELAEEERQLVAGIRGHYELGELEGKHIVVVANLAPAKLRGEKSQGMLLAAQQDDRLGLLLAPAAAPGTPLRTAGGGEPGPGKITIDEFFAHEIQAEGGSVTLDGEPLTGADLMVDRDLEGRLK